MKNEKNEIMTRMNRSYSDFKELVWPRFSGFFAGGTLNRTDAALGDPVSQCLDWYACIDNIVSFKKSGTSEAIAHRVQYLKDPDPYKSITISCKRPSGPSECEKLLVAAETDRLLPKRTIHAYLWQDLFIAGIIFDTKSFYIHLQDLLDGNITGAEKGVIWGERQNTRAERFLWVSWDFFTLLDIEHCIIKLSPEQIAFEKELAELASI